MASSRSSKSSAKIARRHNKRPPTAVEKTVQVGFKEFTTERQIAPIFGKYTTRNDGFVEHLESVRDKIEAYTARDSAKRPLNILLAAPPGTGKSFLIKQLVEWVVRQKDRAEKIEVAFEEVYVSSLETTGELHDVFRRVQSINLDHKKKLPVVLFDEVDAVANDRYLYAKLLAPMWDGTFYVGKEKFYLGRSIFCFAGSTLSLESESKKIVEKAGKKALTYQRYFTDWTTALSQYEKKLAKEKLPDFLSRIDTIIAIPPMCRALLGDQLNDEFDDLACTLITSEFPTVDVIGKTALAVVAQTIKDKGVRAASKIVFSSQNDANKFDFYSLPSNTRSEAEAEHLISADAFGEDPVTGSKRERYVIQIERGTARWDMAG
jgi:hypothetical protein